MSYEDNDKIKIKLQRHKWPDEIEAEKQERKHFFIKTTLVLMIFAIGFTFGAVFYTKPGVVKDNNVARFERIYDLLVNNWFFVQDMEDPESEMIENAIKGMIERNGDEHTSYMTEKESQDYIDAIDMSFVGIGVQYQPSNNLITKVFKNSPAEKAGLLAGDIMIKVDDIVITELAEDDDIKNYILGEKGTLVKIAVNRQGQDIVYEVTRDQVNALTWGEMLDDETAYLEISSFGSQLGLVTEVYLEEFKQQGAKNLIIDLRDNGGGYLEAINNISDLFFEEGTTIYYEKFLDRSNVEYKVKANNKTVYKYDEIIVLINEASASASEVFALSLRDNLDAKLLGVNTYGKGTVQRQVQDGIDNAYIKYTFAKWYSPKDENIDKLGIKPDIEVRLPDIFYEPFVDLEETKLHLDEVHKGIEYAQKALSFLSYHDGRIDGYYDQNTKSAIEKYKADNELVVNDTIDDEILSAIYSSVLKTWSLEKSTYDTQLIKALEVVKLGS